MGDTGLILPHSDWTASVVLHFKVRYDFPWEDVELQREPHTETTKGLHSQGLSIRIHFFLSLCFLLKWPWPRFSMVPHPQHRHSLPHGGRTVLIQPPLGNGRLPKGLKHKEKNNQIFIKSRIIHSSDLFSPLKVLKIRILPFLNNKHLIGFIICFHFD